MKKLRFNKKTTFKLHKELWTWLAENPTKLKCNWPGWEIHGTCYLHCLFCEYTKSINNGIADCNLCPVEWCRYGGCMTPTSLFHKWVMAGTTERAELALEIAKMKPRKNSLNEKVK